MKILMTGVADNPGGTESFVKDVVSGLHNNHEFSVLRIKEQPEAHREFFSSLSVKSFYVSGIFGLKSILKRKKIFKRFLAENNFDLIHINAPNINSIYMIAAAKELGIQTIYHLHNSNSSGISLLNRMIARVAKRYLGTYILKNASKVVAVSEDAAISWFGKKSDRVFVIYNGINTQKYLFDQNKRNDIRNKYGIGVEAKVAVMVARLEPIKNYEFAFDILDNLMPKSIQTFFVLGDGSQADYLKNYVKETMNDEAIKNVKFVGRTPDVPDYLFASDIGILTSFSEGLGLSVLEGEAAGLPMEVSEGVPRVVDVTGNVDFINLGKGVKYWANKMDERLSETKDRLIANENVQKSSFSKEVFLQKINEMYGDLGGKHEY